MKKYAFTFRGTEKYSGSISKQNFLLRCIPGTYPFQRSYASRLTVNPFAALTFITDAYGNEMYTGAADKKHSRFTFESSGFVLCSKYRIHEPVDRLYLYPTLLTRPTPEMQQALKSVKLSEFPWNRARQLCELTRIHLRFDPAINDTTTAAEAFSLGGGDAKDLAQVLTVLCRETGIAARMVSGLTLGITQPHYWVEVHCDGFWRALDPSRGLPVEEGYLKVANGPDFSACSLFRRVYRHAAPVTSDLSFQVEVTEHVITTRATTPHG